MSELEVTASACVLANIVLVARRSLWNFPFGIAGVGLFALLFWEQRLYATAALQALFLAANIYGWWSWSIARGAAGEVEPRGLDPGARIAVASASALAAVLLGIVLARGTDAASPFLDASNLSASLAAQLLLAARYTDNWPAWVGVNALSVWLYAGQGLWATAGLYLVLLAVAVVGWIAWARAEWPA